MSKPLPEHVTRAEAATVLRLSLRQVDRLAKSGVLKKAKLSASRSGFAREDLDQYLTSLAGAEGYRSPLGNLTLGVPTGSPLSCNEAAPLIDQLLNKRLPGCIVYIQDGCIQISWNAALCYSQEQVFESLKR